MKRKLRVRITACSLAFMMCLPLAGSQPVAQAAGTVRTAEPTISWKSNFGGSGDDGYNAVIAVEDGYVAVGRSATASFGNGDWTEEQSNDGSGDMWAGDAIIVKYDMTGKVLWKHNFGGEGNDSFTAVASAEGGYIAVGSSAAASFGTGDWTGEQSNDDPEDTQAGDAIMVKYDDTTGEVLWKKHFGGKGNDGYAAVTAVEDGYVAVGRSYYKSFGTGDWADVECHDNVDESGARDAIIVKYNFAGDILWRKHFGGADKDEFAGVTAVKDGYIAVGYSYRKSFGTGDWADEQAKGDQSTGLAIADTDDAIIVKYDTAGNILWKHNFGGSSYDEYNAVTAAEDGCVAVGYCYAFSFQDGDWKGIAGKGYDDAVIVKYSDAGKVLWKKHFGGTDGDYYETVTAAEDGYIAAGYSQASSFETGDWAGVEGNDDAIIVKHDMQGNVLWKKNFGGGKDDRYEAVAAVEDGCIAAGYSGNGFDFGDWAGVSGKGADDAIIVKYAESAGGSAEAADYSYEVLEDSTLKITRYKGMATDLTLPDKINGKRVTAIGSNMFSESSVLTTVNVPDGITDIADYAFAGCSNLKNINVSKGNPIYSSYSGCLYAKNGKTLLSCPNGKSEVNLSDGLKTIDAHSFFGCSRLASISIPNSVTKIEYGVFLGCKNLKNVYYAGSKSQWKKIEIRGGNNNLTDAMIYYAAADESDKKPTSLTLSSKALTLKKGNSKKLTYTLTPSGISAAVTFTSSNPSVATVDRNGIVTAKKKGTATITAKASGLTASCKVTVTEEPRLKTPSLTVKLNSANGVKLSWKKVSGAQGYYVYRATSKNGSYKKIKKVKGTSYVNNKLKSGKTYYYKVAAYKGSTLGAKSKAKSKKIIGRLATPKMTISVDNKARKFTISWGKVKNAAKIEIVRENEKGVFKKWDTVSAKKKKADYAYPKHGTKYRFALRAYYIMDGKKIYSANSKPYTLSF